ncbi:MAG TPA: glycoside hydrolase family 43 protein, partial [Lachnospiraceae bacterium]|nr:glycoside hydrolase family 43 protein [Lachnospiraceae bacterium]
EMSEAFVWAKTDTFWAPDVIQLADGRYYMYYCTCEGSMPLSTLGIAVADNIEGPYEDLGIILKSGMGEDIPSEDGDVYNAGVQPNVVDPCVYYDKEGRLWMMYGSYSGGIFVLELNPKTGFPLEKGYGKKILGANHLRIEGSYVLYNEETKYYYMFLSYGGLAADGGYNIRVARSENPDGPFYDTEGNDMIDCKGPDGSFFDDSAAMKYGAKLMGNYRFAWVEGENGKIRQGLISPGHNSAIYDEENGKYYIIFHTRFEGRGEEHEVRVHQLFFNEKGWPVIAPYRYIGETIGSYEKNEIVGTYKFINHMHDISADVKVSDEIILNEDGSISGKIKGTWELVGEYKAKLMVNNVEYTGVFLKQWDEYGLKYVMTFTALSDKGYAIWGSGLEALNNLD